MSKKCTCTDTTTFPSRVCSNLFVHARTLDCAWNQHCVACAYKIACFDVALDTDFCRRVPNVRPELCPRATKPLHHSPEHQQEKEVLGYKRGLRVLTVGDGDFSFSLAVARIVGPSMVCATSYETQETLERVYDSMDQTMKELRPLQAQVLFQVDATRLSDTLSNKDEETFDRIVWNFPCTAIAKGLDGQNQEMNRNKDMIRTFVAQARHYLVPNGQIHINHKTKPPFNQWDIETVAVEQSQNQPVVYYLGRIVLDRFLLPPYTPRKALCRKSFPAHDACTYIFGLSKDDTTLGCDSGDDNEVEQKVSPSDDRLLPVTKELIQNLRSLFLENDTKQRPKKRSRIKR